MLEAPRATGQGEVDVRIRQARAEDAAVLAELAVAAKRSWGYPDEWMLAWSRSLTIDAEVISTMRVHLAEDAEGEILGFYALAGSGRSVQLEHLWVQPGQMGRGVGRALVEHALAAAALAGAQELVIESDPNAEAFYRRMGAVRVGMIPAPMPGAPSRTLPVLKIATGRCSPAVGP